MVVRIMGLKEVYKIENRQAIPAALLPLLLTCFAAPIGFCLL
jgi:hypothetical protein